jgi:acyl phosphate:glycerol-3-phosphate acyltransferase
MNYILSISIGYILGSFPTAYILLKRQKGIDITRNGSGNVGALNSFEVSSSKSIGIAVLLIDLVKGLLSVLLVKQFIGNDFTYQMVSLVFAVFAHSFCPWINFNGGRGLATAAGGMLALSIPILIIWIASWLVTKTMNRNVHIANVSATIISILLCILIPETINKFGNPPAQNGIEFSVLVSIMFVVILVKHINPLIQLFNEQRKISRIKYEQQQN